MAKPLKPEELKEKDERIPFDDALRKILAAPPMHKAAKKPTKRKKAR